MEGKYPNVITTQNLEKLYEN